jgi:hypothetical protein
MTIPVIDVLALSLASPLKNILLAPIVTNFPHIHIQLGSKLDNPLCTVLCCVVDTAAALTMGNFYFVVAIVKWYPHCVGKFLIPKEYNPIMLSGIVQRGGKSITTKLTIGFQFRLPYLTRDGSQTSLLIANGPHVTVNTIVGLLFIQATQAIINLLNDLAKCQLHVAKAYRLTLSLKKSHFFPKRFEFVGIDVSLDGNRPAVSKHELLKHWPTPTIVRDIDRLVGFLQIYSKFIQCFNIHAEPLRKIMKREYTKETKDGGCQKPRLHLSISSNASSWTPVCIDLILPNSHYSSLISPQKGLGTLYANQATTKSPLS